MRTRLNIMFVRTLSSGIMTTFYGKDCTTVRNTDELYHKTVVIFLALKEGNMGSHNKIWIQKMNHCPHSSCILLLEVVFPSQNLVLEMLQ